jgi:hypothetical protein
VESATRLVAQIPASDLAAARVAYVSVRLPGALGTVGNALPFLVENPLPVVTAAALVNGQLQVAGGQFAPGAQIVFNGALVTPAALSSSAAGAPLTAAPLATSASASVTVLNPEPGGGAALPVLLGAPPVAPPPGTARGYLPIVRK